MGFKMRKNPLINLDRYKKRLPSIPIPNGYTRLMTAVSRLEVVFVETQIALICKLKKVNTDSSLRII